MLANSITMSRIILSIILLFLKPFSIIFLIIYTICGLTDIADGYIARKTKTESKFGAKLDTIADLIFFIVMAIIIYPIILGEITYIVYIGIILIIKCSSIILIFKKYKTFAILHTYGNKIIGLILFLFPYFINKLNHDLIIYTICTVALVFSIEELLINITSKTLEINKKSIIS
ncbi:MAG: CDP-alcohol phosphatidyltransferase family protein [Clostridia bacterium]|nr:CDP-alcohol phosphatidyltransferase family protein [Clostridia bacterium]